MKTCAPAPAACPSPASSPSAVRHIEDWLRHNRPQTLSIARRILSGNRDEAEDAVAEAALRAIRSAHTYNPAQVMRRWFCRIVTVVCVMRFAWAGKAKEKPQTQRLVNAAKNTESIAGSNTGNEMDLRFDFGDGQTDDETDVENAVKNGAGASTTMTAAELVTLPDCLLETLIAMDQEMASLLLELYVLRAACKERAEGRGWSAYQLNEQVRAAHAKLEKLRAARGCVNCDGGCGG